MVCAFATHSDPPSPSPSRRLYPTRPWTMSSHPSDQTTWRLPSDPKNINLTVNPFVSHQLSLSHPNSVSSPPRPSSLLYSSHNDPHTLLHPSDQKHLPQSHLPQSHPSYSNPISSLSQPRNASQIHLHQSQPQRSSPSIPFSSNPTNHSSSSFPRQHLQSHQSHLLASPSAPISVPSMHPSQQNQPSHSPQSHHRQHQHDYQPQHHHLHQLPVDSHPQQLVQSPSNPTPTGSPPARKKQYRFTVSSDVALLQLVLEYNPYAAPHGGRLHKWHTVANLLRRKAIDIDFRRARDRTTLLLEQWRGNDFHSLRRCASGNQQEQDLKEKLLAKLSAIESAAKPRENVTQWRPRPDGSLVAPITPTPSTSRRLTAATSSNSPPAAGLVPTVACTDTPVGPHMGSADEAGFKFASLSGASHVQSLVPPGDGHVLTSPHLNMVDAPDSHQHGPPNKMLKNNDGHRSNNQYSTSLFANDTNPQNPVIAVANAVAPSQHLHHHSSHNSNDLVPYRPDLSLARSTQSPGAFKPNADAQLDHPPPLPMSTRHPPNIDGSPSISKSTPEAEIYQLREKVYQLEAQVKELKRSQATIEQQLQWERERENRRLQLEKERIEKEYEDRKAEREERRRREQRDKEEREQLMKIIIRHRLDPRLNDPDNPV